MFVHSSSSELKMPNILFTGQKNRTGIRYTSLDFISSVFNTSFVLYAIAMRVWLVYSLTLSDYLTFLTAHPLSYRYTIMSFSLLRWSLMIPFKSVMLAWELMKISMLLIPPSRAMLRGMYWTFTLICLYAGIGILRVRKGSKVFEMLSHS